LLASWLFVLPGRRIQSISFLIAEWFSFIPRRTPRGPNGRFGLHLRTDPGCLLDPIPASVGMSGRSSSRDSAKQQALVEVGHRGTSNYSRTGTRPSSPLSCTPWWLHKFRATCITRLLQSGMDLRTVMKFSCHSHLDSVMRYLSPAADAAIKAHINSVKWM